MIARAIFRRDLAERPPPPLPPRSKRFDVYLYLAIRDSKYLALRDQGAALAAATDLALPPSLRKPVSYTHLTLPTKRIV